MWLSTKINFSDKVFTRHGIDMDRIYLNALCSLITTIQKPGLRLISITFSMIRFLSLLTKRPVFLQNTSDKPICSSVNECFARVKLYLLRKSPDFGCFFLFKKKPSTLKNPEFQNLATKKPNLQPCLTFNTPSNEWWRFSLKPHIRLLPHKRTKNIQAMLF